MIQRRETLDDILERMEDFYDSGQVEKVRKELRRARGLFPDDLTLLEWEATFASDEGRLKDALKFLETVLAEEPERPFARREKTLVLMALGRFEDALDLLLAIGPEVIGPQAIGTEPGGLERTGPEAGTGQAGTEPAGTDPAVTVQAGDAAFHFDKGLCLDHLGRTVEADKAFRKAAGLDPEGCTMPLRLSEEDFGRVVTAAFEGIPKALQGYLANVVTEVRDYPTSPPLDPGFDPGLLGLYVGVPRTERTQEYRDHMDRIFIFKRNLEIEFPDRAVLLEEIRKTVIHEIAHHFGLGEEDMGGYA